MMPDLREAWIPERQRESDTLQDTFFPKRNRKLGGIRYDEISFFWCIRIENTPDQDGRNW